MPYSQAVSPSTPSGQTGVNLCQDTPATIYFWPGLPYGLKGPGDKYDIIGHGEPESQGYNCAPINPYFIGWTNQFNAIDALLGAAAGKVTVNELDFEQEIDMVDYTALLRFMYDNAQANTYNGAYPGCSASPVDIVCVLRTLMTNHGFDPGRTTWSAAWNDATTATENCLDIYQDYARQFHLGAVASAFGGGYVGRPDDAQPIAGLWCGGTLNYQNPTMLPVPIYHTQPDIVDSHMYPHVEGAGSGDTQVQQVAALDFSNLTHFLSITVLKTNNLL